MNRLILQIGLLFAALLTTAALVGCDEQTAVGVEPVRIDGEVFHLELAADARSRTLGLGGRDYIAPDGGMLFVFPRAQQLQFVMRDCLVDIDIIFLDAAGRVTAKHHMPAEALPEPKGEDESAAEYSRRRSAYEATLPRYGSRYAAQFAIELAGGRLEDLDVSEGDKIELDLARLKSLAE